MNLIAITLGFNFERGFVDRFYIINNVSSYLFEFDYVNNSMDFVYSYNYV